MALEHPQWAFFPEPRAHFFKSREPFARLPSLVVFYRDADLLQSPSSSCCRTPFLQGVWRAPACPVSLCWRRLASSRGPPSRHVGIGWRVPAVFLASTACYCPLAVPPPPSPSRRRLGVPALDLAQIRSCASRPRSLAPSQTSIVIPRCRLAWPG